MELKGVLLSSVLVAEVLLVVPVPSLIHTWSLGIFLVIPAGSAAFPAVRTYCDLDNWKTLWRVLVADRTKHDDFSYKYSNSSWWRCCHCCQRLFCYPWCSAVWNNNSFPLLTVLDGFLECHRSLSGFDIPIREENNCAFQRPKKLKIPVQKIQSVGNWCCSNWSTTPGVWSLCLLEQQKTKPKTHACSHLCRKVRTVA